jgi:hypothetical protein
MEFFLWRQLKIKTVNLFSKYLVMTTVALRKYLVSKINLLEDDAVLDELKKIVDRNEKVYVLSEYQLEKIAISRKQIEEGNFLTQEEMDRKVEEWAKRK